MPTREQHTTDAVAFAGACPPIAEALAAALRCPTLSYHDDAKTNREPFDQLHATLRERFPLVHRHLRLEQHGLSLLFEWPGREPDRDPWLWLAHQDVAPVGDDTEQARWTHPPFAGAIADGYVWGRGALDDKASLIAILTACETLLAEGFQPLRTVWLAFGEDEEVGGRRGARRLAQRFANAGLRFEMILDEGLTLTQGIVRVLPEPVAMIGIAEKGYLTVRLRATGGGGHASLPTGTGAVGRLARGLVALAGLQFPARINPVVAAFFEALAPRMPLLQRVVMSHHRWLAPLITRVLSRRPDTNVMLRTTFAVTGLAAGEQDNVLPTTAEATVNLRIGLGDRVAEVVERLERLLKPLGITVEPDYEKAHEPTPITPTTGAPYRRVAAVLRDLWPEAALVPNLHTGASDSRHYTHLSDSVIRFAPLRLAPDDLRRFHGVDERIAVRDLVDAADFYRRLLEHE